MNLLLALVASGPAFAVPPSGLGDLIVTEIQADPNSIPQYYGEWFELYNNSGRNLDLNDVLIERDSESFVIAGPPITVGIGDYIVFGVSSNTSNNGNVPIDYVYDFFSFNLVGSADSLTVSIDGTVLDVVDWDSGWSFATNRAHACAPNASANEWANDLALNWCSSEVEIDLELSGTPGGANEYCGGEGNQDNDGDTYAEFEGDCNDEDATVYPGQIDGSAAPYGVANDDADCDGIRDDGDTDDDGDGYSEVAGDCDDANAEAHPFGIEVNDGVDNDCDGCPDELDIDIDGDLWTECPTACDSDGDGDIDSADVACFDCNEGDADVNPVAVEIPYDGVDQNCNGDSDECDVDGDNYDADATAGPGCAGPDCNDADEAVHPGVPEDPANGKDDDCDDVIDIPDRDADGFTEADGDCMDLGEENGATPAEVTLSKGVNPAAAEVCFNQLDDDCDGWIDNGEKCSRSAEFSSVRGGGVCGVSQGAAGGTVATVLAALATLSAAARRRLTGPTSRNR